MWAAGGVIAVGATFRIARYVDNRSLWLDEVFLANNLIGRSFARLFQPLDYRQGAPILFLLLSKLSITVLGHSEYALRLVPLISGLLALPLFHFVARRLVSPAAALLGLGLMAVLEPLIYYS